MLQPQGVEDAAGIQRGGQPALVLQQALQKRRESGIGGNLQQYGLTILKMPGPIERQVPGLADRLELAVAPA